MKVLTLRSAKLSLIHICKSERMWPHASHTTSECGLSDRISGRMWVLSHLNSVLTTSDRITQGGF